MNKHTLTLIAGVEITGGRLGVRKHGAIETGHDLGDPVAAARRWIGEGATWLHVEDLDAAAGTGSNAGVIHRILDHAGRHVHVQLAGGIRDADSLAAALHTGAGRIVLDTVALEDPAFVSGALSAHPDRVAVDLTATGNTFYVPGSRLHGADVMEWLDWLHKAGATTYVVNDVDGEGTRKGSDRHLLAAVCARAHGHVVACGGVERLEHLHSVADHVPAGLDAIVIDRALATGNFSFAEALVAIAPRFDPYEWGPARP